MYDHLLALAKLPPDNPLSWSELGRYERYLITPIDHDYPGKTARLWNAAYDAFGINARMSMMVGSPAQVREIVRAFRNDPKYAGGGVGTGFKEAVIPCLDEATPEARAIGAVNIIKKTPDGKLVGGNTDGIGYAESLAKIFMDDGRSLAGAQVLMLGAGGSGRAIAFALASVGAQLIILNRTEPKAVQLAKDVNAYLKAHVARGGGRSLIPETMRRSDAVVSVIDDAHSPLDGYSPLGDMALPVSEQSVAENVKQSEEILRHVRPHMVVSDIRLRNTETPMLAQARRLRLRTLSGVPMVVNQGIRAFWWLHQDALVQSGTDLSDVEHVLQRAALP